MVKNNEIQTIVDPVQIENYVKESDKIECFQHHDVYGNPKDCFSLFGKNFSIGIMITKDFLDNLQKKYPDRFNTNI